MCAASINGTRRRSGSRELMGYGDVWNMTKILVLTGSFVGGTIGWWLGAFVGTMTAFMISMVGTGVGVYIGRRIASEFV
jgi:F0F1-type ATP synthase assembly protein I